MIITILAIILWDKYYVIAEMLLKQEYLQTIFFYMQIEKHIDIMKEMHF